MSTIESMDYASWSRVTFPTENERLAKKSEVLVVNEGLVVREGSMLAGERAGAYRGRPCEAYMN